MLHHNSLRVLVLQVAKAFSILAITSALDRVLNDNKIERAVVNAMESILKEMRNEVLDSSRPDRWQDQTGNLTKSIFTVVIKPMSVKSKSIPDGQITIRNTESGLILGFLVAGMEYAAAVEFLTSRDVIMGTVDKWKPRIEAEIAKRVREALSGN